MKKKKLIGLESFCSPSSAACMSGTLLLGAGKGGGGLVCPAGHVFRFNKKRWNVLTFWLCCLVLSVGRVGPTPLPGI